MHHTTSWHYTTQTLNMPPITHAQRLCTMHAQLTTLKFKRWWPVEVILRKALQFNDPLAYLLLHKELPLSMTIEDVAIAKEHKRFNTTNFYSKFIYCFNSNNHDLKTLIGLRGVSGQKVIPTIWIHQFCGNSIPRHSSLSYKVV